MNYYINEDVNFMAAEIACKLYENKVVAIFNGKSEMGPRALGNRSILVNPCWSEAKDYLNKEIKFREYWRPYAPIVADYVTGIYFENDYISPYMSFSTKVRKEYTDKLSGITHKDRTARIQTVSIEQNEFIFKLLCEFEKLSGFPILLNTSFNIDGQPVVETPKDAISTFTNSKIDYLVMNEKYLVERN